MLKGVKVVGVVICLLLLTGLAGCRKPLEPITEGGQNTLGALYTHSLARSPVIEHRVINSRKIFTIDSMLTIYH